MKPVLALCYGTRPQTIKASVLRRALAAAFDVIAIDTGQHYDFVLNGLLYRQLAVAAPDCFLEVGSGSHAAQTAAILVRVEELLLGRRPAVVVVIGDTNSTLGCALAAAKLRIPVTHVEAGLRATDALMAEELNRRATDALACILCTPSTAATRRLQRELPDRFIRKTGDIARDVLLSQLDHLPSPASIVPSVSESYLFATIHRAEITGRPALLRALLDELGTASLPTVLAMHPRTRAALEQAGFSSQGNGRLTVIPATGYREALALVHGAAAVLTDSGGIQREAYWLGVPCITLRKETEWEETVALGANHLLAPEDAIGKAAGLIADLLIAPRTWDRDVYGNGDAAAKVVAAIQEGLA